MLVDLGFPVLAFEYRQADLFENATTTGNNGYGART